MAQSDRWKAIHSDYKAKDWINKPSIFAKEAIEHFPKTGRLLELGAGHGQDSRFFAKNGYDVVSTDNGEVGLEENRQKNATESVEIDVRVLDLNDNFEFEDESFDIVYAHLSLHYFSNERTREIFDEIYRVLKPSGIFAFFTNSTDDPEFNTGTQLEDFYFEVEGLNKRYLNVAEAKRFAHRFDEILCDNNGETYKDSAKGIHNLVRYIGKKPAK